MELDHAVINVKWEMDRAVPLFVALGFSVSPRGYHSLGSINHLMVFPENYLELIGLPAGTEKVRQDVLDAPVGINGLVFKIADADETHDRLRSCGFAPNPPKSFSRPVTADGEEHLARFRTVNLDGSSFPAGRVYFCEHQTPELVWRQEWMNHANRTTNIQEVVVVAEEPEATAVQYAAAAGVSGISGETSDHCIDLGVSRLSFLSPARYRDRYGELALAMNGRTSMFGAIGLSTADPGAAAQAVDRPDMTTQVTADRTLIGAGDCNALLEFTR